MAESHGACVPTRYATREPPNPRPNPRLALHLAALTRTRRLALTRAGAPRPGQLRGDGRGRPHARHGLRAADPQDRLADPPGQANAAVVRNVAEGRRVARARLSEGVHSGPGRLAEPPREHPHQAGACARSLPRLASRPCAGRRVSAPRASLSSPPAPALPLFRFASPPSSRKSNSSRIGTRPAACSRSSKA